MSNPLPIPAREAQAKREIGLTNISPVCKAVLLAGLIVLLLLTTAVQLVVDRSFISEFRELPRAAARGWEEGKTADHSSPLFIANRHMLNAMGDWEDLLEDTAWFHDPLLQFAQPILWRLGSGNGQAVRGRGDWLLYQPDIDYLVQGPFDAEPPLAAILDFRDQLAERDIRLVIVPAPAKTQLQPDALTAKDFPLPLRNPAEVELFESLRTAGVTVIDAAALLADFDTPTYLLTDTHWTPQAMRHVAEQTAAAVQQLDVLPDPDPTPVTWDESEITHFGDIAEMLALPSGQTLIAPETIQHTRAELETDAPPTVLVMGDSFSNIFSLETMGWGENGGFADHLSAALRQPVLRLIRNDAGASATREMLSRDLARGQDRLDGIQVVVWQFAARELKFGDWRPMRFRYRPRTRPEPEDETEPEAVRDGGLLEGEKSITVTATLQAVSTIPRPGQVAYADHVASAHLTGLRTEDGRIINAEAVARFQSMRNHTLQEGARWRTGQQLRLRLIPFSDVEDRYGALNTSELDDFDLMLAIPFWIEEVLP